ncbi:MAG: hypothetical protein ACLPYS_00020 [Vulcanimicrobiaceae bacterium]
MNARSLLGAAAGLTLLLAGASNSPSVAQDSGIDYGSLEASTASSIKAVLKTASDDKPVRMRSASLANEPLKIPMITDTPRARVQAGQPIALGWVGGTPGYRALLEASASQPPLETQTVTTTTVVFKTASIKPGTYIVLVTDAKGQTQQSSFEVAPSAVPPKTDLDQLRIFPPAMQQLMGACLYARAGREWYLAAYQRLAALPDDFPSADSPDAGNLRNLLVTGAPLPAN